MSLIRSLAPYCDGDEEARQEATSAQQGGHQTRHQADSLGSSVKQDGAYQGGRQGRHSESAFRTQLLCRSWLYVVLSSVLTDL